MVLFAWCFSLVQVLCLTGRFFMVGMSWARYAKKPPLEKVGMEFLQAGCR